MTKLQENQEYILTKIYEKRPISKYGRELSYCIAISFVFASK